MKAFDLRNLGHRTVWDESRIGLERDPWNLRIPGRFGHVCPWGPDLLAVSVDGHPRIAARVRRRFTIVQDGDDGVTATFSPERLDEVAEIVGLRRKRKVSAAQRERLVSAGSATRFGQTTGANEQLRSEGATFVGNVSP